MIVATYGKMFSFELERLHKVTGILVSTKKNQRVAEIVEANTNKGVGTFNQTGCVIYY